MTGFVRNPDDSFSRVVASYISVASSTALGQILQVQQIIIFKLEDLKVLKRSPDLLNNVTIGHGQLQLIMEQILFYHIWGLQTFWSSDLNNVMNNPSNSPVISEKQMFR